MDLPGGQFEFLTKPIVETWLSVLRRGGQAKKDFNDVAEVCDSFYRKSSGFMWKDSFRAKFIGDGVPVPRYEVTVNTAFEYVALFKPRLFWANPYRHLTRPTRVQLDFNALSGGDPYAAMAYQQFQMQQSAFDARTDAANALWEAYLNYTPEALPYGGLSMHAGQAIDEALITGLGLSVPRTYMPSGGQTNVTGCFYQSSRDLVVDPDCVSPLWEDAQWIALRHRTPYWELERRFGWPEGSLKGKGQYESGASQAILPQFEWNRRQRAVNDIVEWFEIWSKCGVGTRFKRGDKDTLIPSAPLWDQTVGDHAYLCITSSLGSPLNLPAWWLATSPDASTENVAARMEWPIPYWKDDKWPVSPLAFYTNFRGPWPQPPLSCVIGEMICLQILLSFYMQNAETNSQSVIAYMESAAKQVEGAFKTAKSPVYIKLIDGMQQKISDLVSFLQRPNQSTDTLEAIEWLTRSIERKTGLSSLLYGEPGETQDRSAAATNVRAENISLRPDFMGKQVAAWQSDAADKERICAYYTITGQDVTPILGPAAQMWDQIVRGEDEETVIRGMRCRVEASDMRRPNRDAEYDQLTKLGQSWLPVAEQAAMQTGNYGPINAYVKALGDSQDQDYSELAIPDAAPQPQEMPVDEGEHIQKLGQQDEAHRLKMRQQKEQHAFKLKAQREQSRAKVSAMRAGRNGSRNGAKT